MINENDLKTLQADDIIKFLSCRQETCPNKDRLIHIETNITTLLAYKDDTIQLKAQLNHALDKINSLSEYLKEAMVNVLTQAEATRKEAKDIAVKAHERVTILEGILNQNLIILNEKIITKSDIKMVLAIIAILWTVLTFAVPYLKFK